eukprot:SAG25_NODE_2721_length_1422_cov_2.855631_1_plen_306_part_10
MLRERGPWDGISLQVHMSWQNDRGDGDDDKGKSVNSSQRCSDSDPKYTKEGQCCFSTDSPPPLPPPPPSSPFPRSKLVTLAQAKQLNSWAAMRPNTTWSLCYSSFTMGHSDAHDFHAACDSYKPTFTVARNTGGAAAAACSQPPFEPCHLDADCNKRSGGGSCVRNSGGYVFGGFADDDWSSPGAQVSKGSNKCFIFGLGPGEPVHFQPMGTDKYPMQCEQDTWPTWVWGDYQLAMGYSAGPGIGASCEPVDPICGGHGNWGETQLEIWRLASISSCGAGADPRRSRVCCSRWLQERSALAAASSR